CFCVLDFDDPALAAPFLEKRNEIITTVVSTPSGGKHCYFSGTTRNRQCEGFDVKSDGGYVVAPPSIGYSFDSPLVAPRNMNPFPEDYLAEYDAIHFPKAGHAITREVRDAARYVMSIESHGSRGSKGLVRACAVLRDAGFTEAEAMVVLIKWNS